VFLVTAADVVITVLWIHSYVNFVLLIL